jgi:RNA polymerase sigma-54 factor
MALAPKLELRQGQQLVMTPQLQQAIRLLQLSNVELCTFVEAEVERNPLLERDEVAPEPSPEAQAPRADNEGEGDNDWVAGEGPSPLNAATRDEGEASGAPQPNGAVPEAGGWASLRPRTNNAFGGEDANLEDFVAAGLSLADYLTEQLHVAITDPAERLIGAHLIHTVDEAGYLRIDLDDLDDKLGAPAGLIDKVLRVLQGFDPPGVFARDLRECLLIQLRQLGQAESLAAKIVAGHLSLVEAKRFDKLAKELKVRLEQVAEAVKMIASLEPKPGRNYSTSETRYVTPDVFVHKVGEEYVVTLNEEGMPRLRVSSFYRRMLGANGSPEARGYIQEKMRAAAWLIKSIHQRQRTLYMVTSSIVKFQMEFLERGVAHLRPLVLKDVANDIGMHESTVSRATAGKYVHTPQGTFELKYFFTSSLRSGHGEEVSAESVKDKIRNIIAAEDSKKPYSDQHIAEMLAKEQIDIARRTVAKYRELMGILPSSKRKAAY